MENHGRYGSYIYSANDRRLMVNLFIPSVVHWREKGIELRQTTAYPDDGIVTLGVKADRPADFTLSVRIPGWVDAAKVRFRLNGKDLGQEVHAGSYFDLQRTWSGGDVLQAYFPTAPRIETSAGGGYAAFFHGPLLLAAPLGREGLEKSDFYADGSVPFIQLVRKEMDPDKVPAVPRGGGAGLLTRSAGDELRYTLATTTGPRPMLPFHRIGLERYSIYFPLK
ncbi:beta-L-arabinofuranosidase domain-containing protein [Luteolibacter marinus]|uniref:beta-L-arabinofuranosidase domain-containing protein n=1 Tax=Luteolibacter marinus TaxID=2776705 RepID=UPI001868505A